MRQHGPGAPPTPAVAIGDEYSERLADMDTEDLLEIAKTTMLAHSGTKDRLDNAKRRFGSKCSWAQVLSTPPLTVSKQYATVAEIELPVTPEPLVIPDEVSSSYVQQGIQLQLVLSSAIKPSEGLVPDVIGTPSRRHFPDLHHPATLEPDIVLAHQEPSKNQWCPRSVYRCYGAFAVVTGIISVTLLGIPMWIVSVFVSMAVTFSCAILYRGQLVTLHSRSLWYEDLEGYHDKAVAKRATNLFQFCIILIVVITSGIVAEYAVWQFNTERPFLEDLALLGGILSLGSRIYNWTGSIALNLIVVLYDFQGHNRTPMLTSLGFKLPQCVPREQSTEEAVDDEGPDLELGPRHHSIIDNNSASILMNNIGDTTAADQASLPRRVAGALARTALSL